MSWAAKRQIFYAFLVLVFLGLVSSYPIYYFFIKHTPTCSDGIQNEGEVGVDCGGICPRACFDQVVPQPLVSWARVFPVSGTVYNLVAYIQNPNVSYVGTPTRYLFKVFDKENQLIDVVENKVPTPPTHTYPIFEQGFDAGKRTPDHATFDFTDDVIWYKYKGDKSELSVTEEVLSNATSSPRLDAIVNNRTTNTYKNVEVVAILYDDTGNAIQASRTFIPVLADNDSVHVNFTWPTGFDRSVATIEIIPKVPFGNK